MVYSSSTNGRSNADFLCMALLPLYRRGVVSALLRHRYPTTRLGRELTGSTVGISGLSPAGQALATTLCALGVRAVGSQSCRVSWHACAWAPVAGAVRLRR